MSSTLTAEELAAALGVSTWTVYEAVKRGDCPVEPIRIGRRLLWPRARVEQLLGPAPTPPEDGGGP